MDKLKVHQQLTLHQTRSVIKEHLEALCDTTKYAHEANKLIELVETLAIRMYTAENLAELLMQQQLGIEKPTTICDGFQDT